MINTVEWRGKKCLLSHVPSIACIIQTNIMFKTKEITKYQRVQHNLPCNCRKKIQVFVLLLLLLSKCILLQLYKG